MSNSQTRHESNATANSNECISESVYKYWNPCYKSVDITYRVFHQLADLGIYLGSSSICLIMFRDLGRNG